MDHPNRVCPECMVTFTAKRIDGIFCTPEHRATSRARDIKAARRVTREFGTCEACFQSFLKHRSDSRHCSTSCRNEATYAGRRPAAVMLRCLQCGKQFPRRTNQKFCSLRCQTAARYDRDPETRQRLSREYTALHKHTETYRAAQQAKYNRRRARKLAAGGAGLTTNQWRRMLRRAGGQCFYCRKNKKLTMDHVVPLSRGGRHEEGNVVAACGSCNYSKGSKFLVEWRLRQRLIAPQIVA